MKHVPLYIHASLLMQLTFVTDSAKKYSAEMMRGSVTSENVIQSRGTSIFGSSTYIEIPQLREGTSVNASRVPPPLISACYSSAALLQF